MAKAWVFRRNNRAGNPWSVGWYEPGGRRRSKSFENHKAAETFRTVKANELLHATCGIADGSWDDLRAEFEVYIQSRLRPSSREAYTTALDHFQRLVKPKKVAGIAERHIDAYITKRLKERGVKPGSTVSKATVNKELRAIKRMFSKAKDWKYVATPPKIEFLTLQSVRPTFVTMADFELIYANCDAAKRPNLQGVSNEDWWRAYLTFLFMTGWRRNEPLRLLRADVDLEAGTATTRASHNKAGREETAMLHTIVVEHLRRLTGFSVEMFQWDWCERGLYEEFHRIQDAAGVRKECRKDHAHNDACGYFSFHDLRRGFATLNATRMSPLDLQKIMRHASFTTTQGYIDMASQVSVVDRLIVPNLTQSRGSQVEAKTAK